MCAVAVTEDVLVRDTVSTPTANAATADVANTTEVFTITPTSGVEKMIIILDIANTNGAVACTLGAGSYNVAKAMSWSCPQNVCSVIMVSDIARFMTAAGTILVTLTPATGKKLLTDHTATMRVIELAR